MAEIWEIAGTKSHSAGEIFPVRNIKSKLISNQKWLSMNLCTSWILVFA
jgi:hypothetical protein